jgi:cytochrome c2
VLTCAECHSFQEGDHERSPSLAKVFGSEIASTGYPNYSDGLKQKQGSWDHETLAAFLTAPQDFAPGTGMPAANVDDPDNLNLLIDFLGAYSLQF